MKKVLNVLLCSMLVLSLAACGKEEKEMAKEYYCEEGILNGANCEIRETEEVKQTCEDGYNLENGKCIKTTSINAKANQSCEAGYSLNGNTCLSNETYDKVSSQECLLPKEYDIGEYTDVDGRVTQNNAYERDGECWYNACTDWDNNICHGGVMKKYEFTTITSCPSGTEEINGNCYKTSQVKTTYSCEKGILQGSKCVSTESKDPLNICETDGFSYNLEKQTCEKITTTKALEKEK